MGRYRTTMKITFDSIKKILILQQRPFGDVLLATSYLKALRERFPDARLDFFVSEPFDKVVEQHPFIDHLIVSPAKGRLFRYLFGRAGAILSIILGRYDLVIDQQGNSGSAVIMMLCFARYRIGRETARGGRYFANFKTRQGHSRYSASMNFDMLAPLGIPEQPYTLHVTIQEKSREYIASWLTEHHLGEKRFICFATKSVVPKKQWSEECCIELISLIRKHTDYNVILTYAPNEEQAVRRLADKTDGTALPGPPTSFNQVAALLTASALLICPDGGLNHLSVATNTPAIAIFSHSATSCWSPQGTFPHHYHLYKPHARDDVTLGITPSEVFQMVTNILKETSPACTGE
jgi:ADP-heptose:LPS heptosyltransferase